MKNSYLNLVNPLTTANLGIDHKIARNLTTLNGEHLIKAALENFKQVGIDPVKSIVYVTKTFCGLTKQVGYSLESYLLERNVTRNLSGYTTDSVLRQYINSDIKQICEALDNPKASKLVLLDDSTNAATNKEETTTNIQDLLNNSSIEHAAMIKLATDSSLLSATIASLDNAYDTLSEMKDSFAEFSKSLYDLVGLREKYITLKKYREMNPSLFEDSEYSLKIYLNNRFSVDLYSMAESIHLDDSFFTNLYYHSEDDYSLLDMLTDQIGYNHPEVECQSVKAMISYFRDSYEATINYINEGIEQTLRMKDILCKLSDMLANNKNISVLLKMAYA